MKRFAMFLVVIVMCIALTGCHSVTLIEEIEVSAIVTEMQYKDSFVWYNPALRIPQTFPEEYLVTVSYEGITETFDDKKLYESVKKGDTIQILLCRVYYENGKLIEQTLQLPTK